MMKSVFFGNKTESNRLESIERPCGALKVMQLNRFLHHFDVAIDIQPKSDDKQRYANYGARGAGSSYWPASRI